MSEESFRELLKEAKELKIEDLAIIQALINHEHLLLQQCKKEKKELIGEFLPHLDWALNELYPTHFNNDEYNDAVRFLKKWGDKL